MRIKYFQPILLALVSMFVHPGWAEDVNSKSNIAPSQASQPTPDTPVADTNGNTSKVRIDHFIVKGNTLLAPALIESLLEPFKGDERTYTDIQLALEALEGAYRNAGYSAVHVVTPEQEVTNGTITFQVLETVIGKVILKGNEHYDQKNIRNALPALKEGFTPNARVMSQNIQLANENPTRQIDVVLALGEQENTVDAQVNVQDTSPHKVFVTLDNTGSQSTGKYRVGVGYQNNNMFNRDEALTLNYITSPNHISDVTQVSASYRIPLYSKGDSIDLSAAYSNTNTGSLSVNAGSLSVTSEGDMVGAHYNHYLARRGDYVSKFTYGLDYRLTIQNCIATSSAFCATTGDVALIPLTLAYNGTLTKPNYLSDYSISFVHNLTDGGKTGQNYFDVIRKDAPANYNLLHLNGSVSGALPKDWQYRVAANAQYGDALLPSEQFALAGANAVRGFVEREFSNDRGYVVNLEMYTPELAQYFKLKEGSLRLLGFFDNGYGWNNVVNSSDTPKRSMLGSVGAGIRYSSGKHLTVKLDVARVECNDKDGQTCTSSNVISRTGNTRGQISVVATW